MIVFKQKGCVFVGKKIICLILASLLAFFATGCFDDFSQVALQSSAPSDSTLKATDNHTPEVTPDVSSTADPTPTPTTEPTAEPTLTPTTEPTVEPTLTPTIEPTVEPALTPTKKPTPTPTKEPTPTPTKKPTPTPTKKPTPTPTKKPTPTPTKKPTPTPTKKPTPTPTPTPLFKGSGTKNDPFIISNLNDLKNLPKVLNKSGYYFKQINDIDCASMSEWIQIGDYDHPFKHNYDGGGYKILNIHFDADSEATALIAHAEDGSFKNINIVNATTDDNHITYENNTKIYPGTGSYTAALVGCATGCQFENCTAVVDFKSSNTFTGGLVGYSILKENQSDLMVNCSVTGYITGGGYTGGLLGGLSRAFDGEEFAPSGAPDIYVKNCNTNVEIHHFVTSGERANIGGLIGAANLIKIDKCYSKGNINVLDGDVGGLVGYTLYATEITRCFSDMEVTCVSDNHYGGVSAGGLIGQMYAYAIVHDCYATGNVNVPYAEWSPCQDDTPRNGGPWLNYYNPCGSLIGSIRTTSVYSDYHKVEVWNCYATGIVNAPNICEDERVYCHGALVGLVLDRYTRNFIIDKNKKDQSDWAGFSDTCILKFEDNYNVEELRPYYTPLNDYKYSGLYGLSGAVYSAMPTHQYVEIVTSDETKNQETFVDWDFENIWVMGENGPELR